MSVTRILVVGDVHAVEAELDDCERLLKLIMEKTREYKPDAVVLLGDSYNNHSTLNLNVIGFWKQAIVDIDNSLGPDGEVIFVLGNHEMTGVYGSPHNALRVHDGDPVLCVTSPMVWKDFVLMPYFDKAEDFVKAAAVYPQKKMICHQSFTGAKMQEGFYDPNGVDMDSVDQEFIVSGHIHLPQTLGNKVCYPGAPRWRSISDANTERALLVLDFEKDKPHPVNTIKIPTDKACRPIYLLEDRPNLPAVIPQTPLGSPTPRIHLDLYGSVEHVRTRKAELEGSGYRIRSFPDQVKKSAVKESDGVSVAFKKYVSGYTPKSGSSKEDLGALAAERVSWLMK